MEKYLRIIWNIFLIIINRVPKNRDLNKLDSNKYNVYF